MKILHGVIPIMVPISTGGGRGRSLSPEEAGWVFIGTAIFSVWVGVWMLWGMEQEEDWKFFTSLFMALVFPLLVGGVWLVV